MNLDLKYLYLIHFVCLMKILFNFIPLINVFFSWFNYERNKVYENTFLLIITMVFHNELTVAKYRNNKQFG